MLTFNFWANDLDFGNWSADSLDQAKEQFASDAGYRSWADMVDQANEFGGDTVEIAEVK
jgi:hypothetical protein